MSLEQRIRQAIPAEWGVTIVRQRDGSIKIDVTQDDAAGADIELPGSWSDDDVVEKIMSWVDDPMMLEWSELRRT